MLSPKNCYIYAIYRSTSKIVRRISILLIFYKLCKYVEEVTFLDRITSEVLVKCSTLFGKYFNVWEHQPIFWGYISSEKKTIFRICLRRIYFTSSKKLRIMWEMYWRKCIKFRIDEAHLICLNLFSILTGFLNRKMSHSKVQIDTRVTVPSFRPCKTWVLERGGGFTQLLKLVVSIITPNKHSDYNYTEYYFNFWRTINTLDSYLSFRRKEYAIHYHWRKPLTNDLTFNFYQNRTSANKEGGEV